MALRITLLIDNKKSWIVPYGRELATTLSAKGHDVKLVHEHEEVKAGDILCLLSCEKIFKALNLNRHNLVVHESALPKGKGWSPLTWQILEGKSVIPVTLFEAADAVDAGPIYDQILLKLEGHELLNEIKHLQGRATADLIERFTNKYPDNEGKPQKGEATFYPRRMAEDSQLDPSKTINEQFNLLRVCDNERYPAFFVRDNVKYILKIEKA